MKSDILKRNIFRIYFKKLDKNISKQIYYLRQKKGKFKHTKDLKSKEKNSNSEETMDKYELTIAKTDKLLVSIIKQVENLLTTVFRQQVPIIDNFEVNQIFKAFNLSDNCISRCGRI